MTEQLKRDLRAETRKALNFAFTSADNSLGGNDVLLTGAGRFFLLGLRLALIDKGIATLIDKNVGSPREGEREERITPRALQQLIVASLQKRLLLPGQTLRKPAAKSTSPDKLGKMKMPPSQEDIAAGKAKAVTAEATKAAADLVKASE